MDLLKGLLGSVLGGGASAPMVPTQQAQVEAPKQQTVNPETNRTALQELSADPKLLEAIEKAATKGAEQGYVNVQQRILDSVMKNIPPLMALMNPETISKMGVDGIISEFTKVFSNILGAAKPATEKAADTKEEDPLAALAQLSSMFGKATGAPQTAATAQTSKIAQPDNNPLNALLAGLTQQAA